MAFFGTSKEWFCLLLLCIVSTTWSTEQDMYTRTYLYASSPQSLYERKNSCPDEKAVIYCITSGTSLTWTNSVYENFVKVYGNTDEAPQDDSYQSLSITLVEIEPLTSFISIPYSVSGKYDGSTFTCAGGGTTSNVTYELAGNPSEPADLTCNPFSSSIGEYVKLQWSQVKFAVFYKIHVFTPENTEQVIGSGSTSIIIEIVEGMSVSVQSINECGLKSSIPEPTVVKRPNATIDWIIWVVCVVAENLLLVGIILIVFGCYYFRKGLRKILTSLANKFRRGI